MKTVVLGKGFLKRPMDKVKSSGKNLYTKQALKTMEENNSGYLLPNGKKTHIVSCNSILVD
jgi:hypothetical protein